MQGDRSTRSPELIRHVGIQQQRIHHTGVALAAKQIILGANAQVLPKGNLRPQPPAEPVAALHALTAVELHHVMAIARQEGGHLQVSGIRLHQHPLDAGMGPAGRRKHLGAKLQRKKARRPRHGHHADGVDPHGGDGGGLMGIP